MKQVLIHTLTHGHDALFNADVRDGSTDHFIYLREQFDHLGYQLNTADDRPLNGVEWVIFTELSSAFPYRSLRGKISKLKKSFLNKPLPRDLYNECINAGMQNRIALFLTESPSISIENWDPSSHKCFPVVFTWKDELVDNIKYFKIPASTQKLHYPELARISFQEKKLLLNISMNKFSRHPKELYSARRSSIHYFERAHPNDFDLYGIGWNQPALLMERLAPITQQKYSSYRGPVKNKWDVLPFYRFSLCYENVCDEAGYVTEKILDCLRSGCVPIYWGASNIQNYVPPEAFIDRRQFKTDLKLDEYISGIAESEYAQFQEARSDYLSSKQFKQFLPPAFAETLINTLKL